MPPSQNQNLELADVFGNIANQLKNDREHINRLDGGNGNHGDNALTNMQLVADRLKTMRGRSADEQLREAAQVLQQNGRGSTANLYASGFQEAAMNLQGRNSIGLDDLLPLLQGLLGGVQRQTNAQQGQGTLLDTLIPAITSFAGARSSGRSGTESIMDALGAAMRGSQQTYQQPSMFGRSRGQNGQSWQDPGAASAKSLLEGLFRSFTG